MCAAGGKAGGGVRYDGPVVRCAVVAIGLLALTGCGSAGRGPRARTPQETRTSEVLLSLARAHLELEGEGEGEGGRVCHPLDALARRAGVAPVDGWGRVLRLHCRPEGPFRVSSAGPDGVHQNEDDLRAGVCGGGGRTGGSLTSRPVWSSPTFPAPPAEEPELHPMRASATPRQPCLLIRWPD